NTLVGINLNWEITTWGKRNLEVQKSKNKRRQAALKLATVRDDHQIQHRLLKDEINEARQLLDAARQGYKFRKEEFRIKSNALENDLILKKEWLQTKVSLSE